MEMPYGDRVSLCNHLHGLQKQTTLEQQHIFTSIHLKLQDLRERQTLQPPPFESVQISERYISSKSQTCLRRCMNRMTDREKFQLKWLLYLFCESENSRKPCYIYTICAYGLYSFKMGMVMNLHSSLPRSYLNHCKICNFIQA